ncbi:MULTISPECIES: CDP-alcohol phosphatidyltransferase family protein [unclassified Francisella]|uniref:CDP-alcohol phosphatidyltransferase family protein n=1 Tax=unclassified Francisella TaxID=2610885 RepID=UPI002E371A2C|nr:MULTISPECIES: CDP-alcohol phosphatidyltransferase family protein [unclassified Francisella]MED7820350.1 CDP-alcohol phosphatidyltransferase family protein [Francisella sp. 19S2-4]MED7831186.1 CDP-alcohol phosphatidyltransferase family protein [Francisella sp. 19S2-10]
MLEQSVRPWFQRYFINKVANILSALNIKPNSLTILSLITGFISAIFILYLPWLAVVFLLVSGYLDVLDGSVARIQKSSSSFGTMLDILSDRFVESVVIIAIFIFQPQIAWVGLIMMMSIIVCISSFLLVGIFSQQESSKSFYYSPGLMERAETFIFFIIMILLPSTVLWLGILFTVLVLWTTFYRVYEFYNQIKVKDEENKYI